MAPPFVDIKTRMIMKKEYIKPEMWVEEMLLESMLAVSKWEVGDEEVDSSDANKRQDRRGTWGDLWAQE